LQNLNKKGDVFMEGNYTFDERGLKEALDEGSLVRPAVRIFAYCDHCGFAIYCEDDALVLNESDDIIHIACWEEYAAEHMFDFAKRASDIEC
jgi:hypothetical protein